MEGGRRGWGSAVGLTVAAVALSVFQPAVLILVPAALLFLALPPRKPLWSVVWGGIGALAFLGPQRGPLWYAERGWALVLGAWFLVMVVLRPRARFFPRALAAVGASVLTIALLSVVRPGTWASFDWELTRQIRVGVAAVAGFWEGSGGGGAWTQQLTEGIYRAGELQVLLYPSLLALASLAALGVAWGIHRRLAAQEPWPLLPLREFRFSDELVWLFILGILLVVLPLGGSAVRAGANVLTFMGALYALRGAGVLLALGGVPGPGGILLATFAVVFLYHLVMIATLLVGLSDTWLDLRARRQRPAAGAGS
jgi:hypothetical protein